ncbi:MAG: VCBS repeat-containing protein, partial [Bacteroidota bacterium]
MNRILFFALCFSFNLLSAQIFTELPQNPLIYSFFSSFSTGEMADLDNDGDLDLFLSGIGSSGFLTTIYTNDGGGNFSEIGNSPFLGMSQGSADFADVDNDGDLDILVIGQRGLLERFAILYLNDGDQNYTEVSGTPFEGVVSGTVDFSDVDSDGDQDVLITGTRIPDSGGIMSKLYLNDGTGNFIELMTAPFQAVRSGSVEFVDIDNDSDEDLFISGEELDFTERSRLYLNDGQGVFTEKDNLAIDGVRA